jgi:para-nitrobenzyl esterase
MTVDQVAGGCQEENENWSYTEVDRRAAEMIANYWVNFAVSGDPNGSGLTKWVPYDVKTEPYRNLGTPPR